VVFACIAAARRQILVVTPYFVPRAELVRALRVAALRGADVRLVVPRENNHAYAGYAGRALYEELLEAGVRVLERRPPFLHAKALVVDDRVAIVGSANLDVRSLYSNYETDVAVYDDAFVGEMKSMILEEIAESDELDLVTWRNRPARARLLENFCSLLTPVL
jgi:cardiolipin synthase